MIFTEREANIARDLYRRATGEQGKDVVQYADGRIEVYGGAGIRVGHRVGPVFGKIRMTLAGKQCTFTRI